MAAGFASSLFGLFSSLVVGLMGRFAGQAANVLKGQFESWLASVVQLSDVEENQETAQALVPGGFAGPATDATMVKLIGALLTDYTRVAGSFDHAARALQDMRGAQSAQSDALARAIDRVVNSQAVQSQLLQTLVANAPSGNALGDVALRIERFADRIMDRAETDGARLREGLQALEQSHAAEVRLLAAHQREAAIQISTAIEHAAAANGPTTDAINTMALRLDRFAERLTDRAEADATRLRDTLQALEQSHANEVRLLDAHQRNTAGQFASAVQQLSADVERRTSLPAVAHIEEALERSLRKGWNAGMGDAGRSIQQLVEATDTRLVDLMRLQDQHMRAMLRRCVRARRTPAPSRRCARSKLRSARASPASARASRRLSPPIPASPRSPWRRSTGPMRPAKMRPPRAPARKPKPPATPAAPDEFAKKGRTHEPPSSHPRSEDPLLSAQVPARQFVQFFAPA